MLLCIDEVTSKIEKWQEPPPTKATKALPVPLPPPRKKRGGRRYRKEKERMQLSELSRQKNRVVFGSQEITDDYTGESFGMIGQQVPFNLFTHLFWSATHAFGCFLLSNTFVFDHLYMYVFVVVGYWCVTS